jgi:L-galactonate 5-dehydrogenase
MKAISITQPNQVALVDTPRPVPSEHQVLLKIKYVGFCGSDLTTYLGKNPMVKYPRIPGHEISATIEAVGLHVPHYLVPNMDVTVVPYTNCGVCPACKRQRFNACQYNETLGVQRDGAMCEYIVVPWQKVLVADGLNHIELAMVEPLTVGFHAVDRGRVTDTDTVMVLGCGMIGVGAIIRSALRGAKVVAVDIDDEKLAVAKELGATHTINSLTENLSERLLKIASGGPDVVIEAAGNPRTYLAAVNEVAFTGRVVCIGYAKDEVSFATKLFVQKEMDILGSRNATPSDFNAVVNYLQRKIFPIEKMVTRVVDLSDAGSALAQWAADPGKVFKILVKL